VPAVEALHVYPVKGCRGIALARAHVEARGIRHDRRWMFVDEHGMFLTQRTVHELARVDVAIEGDALVLAAPAKGMGPLRLSLRPPGGPRRSVTVWRDTVEALDGGPEATAWASALVGVPASLVHMPDDTRRAVKPAYARPDDIVGFADAFPLLLATTASLDDLNARMERPLPMNRFRPNVVLGGCTAWEEDGWTRVRVGAIEMRVPKGCDRCVVTTIDQATAERGAEPLRTMASFRRRDDAVWFAVNAIPDGLGEIAVGDALTVLA
jgi:uncharacterized protein YcbX